MTGMEVTNSDLVPNLLHFVAFITSFFLLFGLPSFPRIIRSIQLVPISLSKKEVTVHSGYMVLMEVDNNSLLIVGDPCRILDQQLVSHPINLLNIIFILITYSIIILNYLN
jgi:hypothetical protein